MGPPRRIARCRPADSFETWLRPDAAGLYCAPGGFHIDPARPVDAAIITHGHSDHARPGHGAVLATPETIAIMQARLGADAAGSFQELRYGETIALGGVDRAAGPAGHILGSAQVVIEHARQPCRRLRRLQARARSDRAPFELVRCDLFVTEATFGLPVFRHEPDAHEIGRLLASLRVRRAHASRRRLRPRQGPAADRAAARRRLRPADLAARRHRSHVRALSRSSGSSWAMYGSSRTRRTSCRRDRAVSAVRPQRPLVAPADRSGHRLCLGLDARARTRPPARRRAAAGDLRPLRLARAGPDDRRDGGRGDLGHARPRGRAGASGRPDGQARRGRWRWSASRRRRANEGLRRPARPAVLHARAATPSCG